MKIIACITLAAVLLLVFSGVALAATGSQGDQYNGGYFDPGLRGALAGTLPGTGMALPLLVVAGVASIGAATRILRKGHR